MNSIITKLLSQFMNSHDLQFISEKDFQVQLAIYLSNELKRYKTDVVCEYPIQTTIGYKDGKEHRGWFDIAIINNGKVCPIELKYRTIYETIKKAGVEINLRNHKAYDYGCYSFLKNICRINEFINSGDKIADIGFAIFLTNDKKYKGVYSGEQGEKSYEDLWIGERESGNGPIYHEKGTSGRVNGNDCELKLPKTIANYGWSAWKERKDMEGSEARNYLIIEVKKD